MDVDKMPPAYARNMPQVATYWAPGSPDGFGGYTFASVVPVQITCRWQDGGEVFRDPQGREVVSEAIVYPDRELQLRGLLVLGDAGTATSSDPRDATGAREIRKVGASPSLSGDEQLYKVYL